MSLRVVIGSRDLTRKSGDIEATNVDPGGFETVTLALTSVTAPPNPGERILITDGLSTVWRGMVAEPGPFDQDKRAAGQVGGVGGGARLKSQLLRMIYADCDMSQWRSPSTQRQLAFTQSAKGSSEATHDITGTTPALRNTLLGPALAFDAIESWYDAGAGNLMGQIFYAWTRGANTNNADTNWTWQLGEASGDNSTGASTGNLRAAGPGSNVYTSSLGSRFAWLQFIYAAAGLTSDVKYDLFWTTLAVFGNHGLSNRGSTSDPYVWPSDIVRHVLSGATGITPGVIQDASGYQVRQCAYRAPTPREQIIDDMAKFCGWHWGVWEPLGGLNAAASAPDRLDFMPPPTAATAFVARGDCEGLPLGQSLSDMYDTLYVTYQDPAQGAGVQQVVLPHPLLPADMAPREKVVDMGQGTAAAATAYGQAVLLLEQANARGAGAVKIPSTVRLPGGGVKPAHLVRAGLDRLKITDMPNGGPVTAGDSRRFDTFRIARVTVSQQGRQEPATRLELDAGMSLVETLNARVSAAGALVAS